MYLKYYKRANADSRRGSTKDSALSISFHQECGVKEYFHVILAWLLGAHEGTLREGRLYLVVSSLSFLEGLFFLALTS